MSFAAYAGDVRTLEIARPNDKLVIDGVGKVFGFLGQVVQRNFYGNGVDEILAIDAIASIGGTRMTSTFWTFTDHQDSVRDIVSGNAADRGKVVEHRQYDSYGRIVRRTTSPVAGSPVTAGVGIDFGYAGRPLEERTGLSDNRARWYEPGTGRFVNEDPSGFKGGDANLFRYVGNDPLNRIDPSGLMAKWAQPASRASVPAAGYAAGYAAIGPGGVSVSGVTPLQPSTTTTATAMPTYSLTSPASSAPRPAAGSSRPSLVSQPYASLVTTVSDSRGRVYDPAPAWAPRPVVESPRWTTTDRIAKLAAVRAYDVQDGGLLRQFVPEYDPTGMTGEYGKFGFSATLSRASDYDPAGSENLYFIAFRGSTWSWWDWLANTVQLRTQTSQFEQSNEITGLLRQRLPSTAELIATGHSKAGAQAVGASFATGVPAIVFNPSSLSHHYQLGTPGNIRTHITFGDPLSMLRTLQNILDKADPPGMRDLRSPSGEVIIHPPRFINTHSPKSLPD